VVDRWGGVVADRAAGLSAEDGHAVAAALDRRPPPLELELDGGTVTLFLVHTVGVRGIGAVLVCRAAARELSAADVASLERATRILGLEVARTELSRSVEARFAGELLEMISSGSRTDVVTERLRAFGVDGCAPLAVCAVAARATDQDDSAGRGVRLADGLTRVLTDRHLPAVVADSAGETMAIFPWRRPEHELLVLVEELLTAVARRMPAGTELVAGTTGVAPGVGGLRPALREARECCRVLRSRPSGPRVRRFDDLAGHRLLLGGHDPGSLRAVAAATLGPLHRHDADRGSGLVDSLRAFLGHDGNMNATAAWLGVHVNTLRNRLAKVAELTGLDVARTADRVDLFLALEAERSARG